MQTALFCFLSDTHQRGPAGLSKPNDASDQAQLENGTSSLPVESPTSQEETEKPTSYVECDDAINGTVVVEGSATAAQDESMDDDPPLAVVDPEREDVLDVDMVNKENAEAPLTTDASADRANDRETEVPEADAVEPSGEVSSGLIDEKEEIDAVTDPQSASIDPQSAASDRGVDEYAGGAGEGNVGANEPIATGDLKNMTDGETMEEEEPPGVGADNEENGAAETGVGEGEDEIGEPPNEGGDSVNDEENDDVEGCGEGEVLEGEEQKEGVDGRSNDERSGGGNAEESGEGSERQETNSVQPEAEES